MAGREIELIGDRKLARERLPMFAGSDIPSSVVRKELIDNSCDVVGERKQPATECCIMLGPNRLMVMDDGTGISTKKMRNADMTHLWAACAKMFSSSNYSNSASKGVSDSVGANGVGLTIANYTSILCDIFVFGPKYCEGYRFVDGFLAGTDECKQNVENVLKDQLGEGSELYKQAKERSECIGDYIKEYLFTEDGRNMFKPYYDNGFMVDITWQQNSPLFVDEGCDKYWLRDYTKERAAELPSGNVHLYMFDDDQFTQLTNDFHWTKNMEMNGKPLDPENPEGARWEYLPSWKEKVEECGGQIFRDGPWLVALNTEPMNIKSIVQGAPIESRTEHLFKIQIQDYSVSVRVPVSIYYRGEEYPPYQDQTKVTIRFPYAVVGRIFERSGKIYQHFYRQAEKAYMAKVIEDSDSNMFYPAMGDPTEAELIISEGYSTVTALKGMRNPMTQACIALRGKISNCWNLDMQKAMQSDVVKQILNAVMNTPYVRIIIAVDADWDGMGHIAPLLLALFARFTNVIQEGKVYLANSPHYMFKKRGQQSIGSNDATECPDGWHCTTCKGLGSMSPEEIKRFVMNPQTRQLTQVVWDAEAEANLDLAFTEGGKQWIA